jgi:hypothetical protein
MKSHTAISWLLVCGMLCAPALARGPQAAASQQPAAAAQSQAPQPGPATAIDPAKAAAIKQLLDLAGGTAAINQVMDGMQQNMKSSMSNILPPGDYREKLVDLFFEKFRAEANTQQLLDIAARVYDKYLTMEDIQGLIQFYSTPLGKKTLTILPKVTVEVQSEGMKWGQDLGQKAMREVLAEHPELVQAMQDAAAKSRPQ